MPQQPTSHDLALSDLFARRGYAPVDPPILQPANLFLDLAGEDLRRRLFLTQDVGGREFCLRPEYTIPVCLAHLDGVCGRADYSYFGPVFRQRPGESGEFRQAGVESLGRTDLDAADADLVALALDGLALYPERPVDVRLGDLGLIEALFAALDVSQAAQRRLIRRLASGERNAAATALAADPPPAGGDYAGLLAAIAGQDPRAARTFVEDVISIAGYAQVGGRTAGEIAERFLARASRRDGGLSETARATLGAYLAIEGPADRVADEIAAVSRDGVFTDAVDRFRRRVDLMAERNVASSTITFSAAFARSLDYYTGLILEVRDGARPDGRFLVAGGRYDRLLERLGAPSPVPAVGFSFWPDRLGEVAP